MTSFLKEYRVFWECHGKYIALREEFSEVSWTTQLFSFDEKIDNLAMHLKRLPARVKSISIFSDLECDVRAFSVSSRIIRSLQSPIMRDRYAEVFMPYSCYKCDILKALDRVYEGCSN